MVEKLTWAMQEVDFDGNMKSSGRMGQTRKIVRKDDLHVAIATPAGRATGK